MHAARLRFGGDIVSRNALYWRCSERRVLFCLEWGTNYCAQASFSRTPPAQLVDYCRTHEASEALNPSIVGKGTVWTWRCRDGAPAIIERNGLDADGFNSVIWFEVDRHIQETPIP